MYFIGQKEIPATRVRCYRKNCKGALVNISCRMAEGMGQMTVRCDKCGDHYAIILQEGYVAIERKQGGNYAQSAR